MHASPRRRQAEETFERLPEEHAAGYRYPFTALVSQAELKLSLLLTVVDPLIGGVVALGHRGTGKSTAVRSLAGVLPPLDAVEGCRFRCDPRQPGNWCSECRERLGGEPRVPETARPVPVVDLPLGATEDRIVGSLDLEAALTRGVKAFEPGVLAMANRGFLYIDEVNLLEDHLVDLLLDVAASGVNVVEREGLSLRHPARFVLVGSGNPEEGDLRPQLLDRFGLYVPVRTLTDVGERVEIVRRRDAFERDPAAFTARFAAEEAALRERIVSARGRLPRIRWPQELLEQTATLCARLHIDGHRGELTIARAAAAHAALEGRAEVMAADIRRVAPLALWHRVWQDPLAPGDPGGDIAAALDELLPAGETGR